MVFTNPCWSIPYGGMATQQYSFNYTILPLLSIYISHILCKPLIGPDLSRYWALVGWDHSVAKPALLCNKGTQSILQFRPIRVEFYFHLAGFFLGNNIWRSASNYGGMMIMPDRLDHTWFQIQNLLPRAQYLKGSRVHHSNSREPGNKLITEGSNQEQNYYSRQDLSPSRRHLRTRNIFKMLKLFIWSNELKYFLFLLNIFCICRSKLPGDIKLDIDLFLDEKFTSN